MEFSLVINGREITRISGAEAAWARFSIAREIIRLAYEMNENCGAWAELRECDGTSLIRCDREGITELGFFLYYED